MLRTSASTRVMLLREMQRTKRGTIARHSGLPLRTADAQGGDSELRRWRYVLIGSQVCLR